MPPGERPGGAAATPEGQLLRSSSGEAEDIDALLNYCATAHLLSTGQMTTAELPFQAAVSPPAGAGAATAATSQDALRHGPAQAAVPAERHGREAPVAALGLVGGIEAAQFADPRAVALAQVAVQTPQGSATGTDPLARWPPTELYMGPRSTSGSGRQDGVAGTGGGGSGAVVSAGGGGGRTSSGQGGGGGGGGNNGRGQSSQLAQDTLEKVFKPWCQSRAAQLFRFAHRHFAAGEGRGGVIFQFARTSDAAEGRWPADESGWRYLPQRSIGSLGIKTNHVLSAVQRYSPQQQCVVIVLVKEAKFDRFYFLNAPKGPPNSRRGGGAATAAPSPPAAPGTAASPPPAPAARPPSADPADPAAAAPATATVPVASISVTSDLSLPDWYAQYARAAAAGSAPPAAESAMWGPWERAGGPAHAGAVAA